jgi:Suppressor of fused protein (SUFU)
MAGGTPFGDGGADVQALVEAHVRAVFGAPGARAAVTFLGAERIEVLRYGGGGDGGDGGGGGSGLLRYVTLGMSAHPMSDPLDAVADPLRGPRAELVLSLRAGAGAGAGAGTDQVLRPLAVLAASPQVEGVVLAPGNSLDLGAPLWPGAPFAAVLVAESGGLLPDLPLPDPLSPVRFFPLLPLTPAEAAWKRVHGAAALQERWLAHATDLRDPHRRAVPLDD